MDLDGEDKDTAATASLEALSMSTSVAIQEDLEDLDGINRDLDFLIGVAFKFNQYLFL